MFLFFEYDTEYSAARPIYFGGSLSISLIKYYYCSSSLFVGAFFTKFREVFPG
jgi:hypothetical protein